jgi:hypothetical protein
LGGEGGKSRDRYADSSADESLPEGKHPGCLGSPRADVTQPRHRSENAMRRSNFV